jgi:hypothetical protein
LGCIELRIKQTAAGLLGLIAVHCGELMHKTRSHTKKASRKMAGLQKAK